MDGTASRRSRPGEKPHAPAAAPRNPAGPQIHFLCFFVFCLFFTGVLFVFVRLKLKMFNVSGVAERQTKAEMLKN
jgi:hypothetical protein